MIKQVVAIESSTSNRIVGFLPVETTTILASIVMVAGIQKMPVTLRNGTTTFVGAFILRTDPFTSRQYYAIVCTSKDDVSIVEGTVGSNIPDRDIRDTSEWVESGFMGQVSIASHNFDNLKNQIFYA